MLQKLVTTYDHCEWTSDGSQCRFPGTISHSSAGPWFCALHFGCVDQVQGRDIVSASLSYTPPPYEHGERAVLVEAVAAEVVRKAKEEIPPEIRAMTIDECRAWSSKIVRSGDIGSKANTRWVSRILSRIENGEDVPMISKQLAEEAFASLRLREPGEDDEQ
jgi:hypothetical protein